MEDIFPGIQKFPTKLVPTTYEAAKIYLDEELLKPKGQQDLTHKMCMLIISDVPNNQDIVFRGDTLNLLIKFKKGDILIHTLHTWKLGNIYSLDIGDMLFYPTIDVPLPPLALMTIDIVTCYWIKRHWNEGKPWSWWPISWGLGITPITTRALLKPPRSILRLMHRLLVQMLCYPLSFGPVSRLDSPFSSAELNVMF